MSNIVNLQGRVAIVTGSSSGNGRAIALLLATEGAYVVCSDIQPNVREGGSEQDLTPTHEVITRNGRSVFQKADVSSEEDMINLVERAVKEFGRLDIFVNNAGIFCGLNDIVGEPVSAFDKTMLVNARGVFLGMKYAITQMMKQEPRTSGERGWVVNIGSIASTCGLAGETSYCASKGAVAMLTRAVAIDYAPHKIHVNAVCPGFISTAMVNPYLAQDEMKKALHATTPWPNLGTPQDVAKAVLVLSSDAASWMTGNLLSVDGGFTAQ
ncbi:uncharacterized protein Z520_04108 [Fonsecaea multimorphosa CBS 102226]|uniref:Uncharacterized protein n=1 Tax=Fonsecaea multimorphosa CBS 102226 TaxID=1442371 RepID=A0A0D2K3Q8_9EURO|nr:uncharacterized protein Z520_04108 [Fonsecaea multimorphosa CBS 102226]KIY00423.1 hypothetical protein Z520_04108 [Fonsecaea multimorphosa CBS 102226]OAL26938.1 hypothetical protein AYO22_03882 [Fonsecaea multimorphosa]